jgi:hypothetical protein
LVVEALEVQQVQDKETAVLTPSLIQSHLLVVEVVEDKITKAVMAAQVEEMVTLPQQTM